MPTEAATELVHRLAGNLAAVHARIAAAAHSAGRDPGSITLVAVSKTQPASLVAAAAQAGQVDFGENRVEEALPKRQALSSAPSMHWHMIGHVQSRKARAVAEAGFALVHSVDSLKLAERLSRYAAAAGRRQAVLLECNVSGEASKAGFPVAVAGQWAGWLSEVDALLGLPGLEVRGLMTMAPMVAHPDQARPCFRRLRELRDYLAAQRPAADWRELSMGMTDDFEAAIAEGATLVRIGRAIFGERA